MPNDFKKNDIFREVIKLYDFYFHILSKKFIFIAKNLKYFKSFDDFFQE